MGNAGLVRATSAEERPAVNDQGTAPEGLEVGGTEASGGAAADEYGVVDALPPVNQVHDRLVAGEMLLDNRTPLPERDRLTGDVHDQASCAGRQRGVSRLQYPKTEFGAALSD